MKEQRNKWKSEITETKPPPIVYDDPVKKMFEDDIPADAQSTPGKISTHGFNSLLSNTLSDLDESSPPAAVAAVEVKDDQLV